jgi:formamidopyrimidine-DNA glycosylase
MPELPDVELFRRRIAGTCLRRQVAAVRADDTRTLRDVSRQRLSRRLKGTRFESTRRHGKHLFVALSGSGWLVMHFGMTGFVEHARDGESLPHTRLTVQFADGSRLYFVDQRRLGFVSLADDPDAFVQAEGLGPDALDPTYAQLRQMLKARRGTVKGALMDQSMVAGIGNIYSDEILFHARIDPRASAAALDDAAYRRLHRQVRRVLLLAADRGADPARMPRSWLLPHRTDGAPCPRGRGEIRKVRISGRGAFFCPACQASHSP